MLPWPRKKLKQYFSLYIFIYLSFISLPPSLSICKYTKYFKVLVVVCKPLIFLFPQIFTNLMKLYQGTSHLYFCRLCTGQRLSRLEMISCLSLICWKLALTLEESMRPVIHVSFCTLHNNSLAYSGINNSRLIVMVSSISVNSGSYSRENILEVGYIETNLTKPYYIQYIA